MVNIVNANRPEGCWTGDEILIITFMMGYVPKLPIISEVSVPYIRHI